MYLYRNLHYVCVGCSIIGVMDVGGFRDRTKEPLTKITKLFGFSNYDEYKKNYPGGGECDNDHSIKFINTLQRNDNEKRIPFLLRTFLMRLASPPSVSDLKFISSAYADIGWISYFPTVGEMCDALESHDYDKNFQYFWYCLDWNDWTLL